MPKPQQRIHLTALNLHAFSHLRTDLLHSFSLVRSLLEQNFILKRTDILHYAQTLHIPVLELQKQGLVGYTASAAILLHDGTCLVEIELS